MTKLRRALLAILILIGVTAVSLTGARVGTAAVPNYFVDIGHVSTCTADGWKVDYTAGSFGSALPWKVKLSTLGWLPAVNTYQVNTIPYTFTTGVLPFSQATAPVVNIDVQWTDLVNASDSEAAVNRPADCVAPTTTTTTNTTVPPTTTTVAPTTTVAVPAVTDPVVVVQPVVEPTTTVPVTEAVVVGEFPVTGKGDGGLFLGTGLLAAGGVALLVARRPKNA